MTVFHSKIKATQTENNVIRELIEFKNRNEILKDQNQILKGEILILQLENQMLNSQILKDASKNKQSNKSETKNKRNKADLTPWKTSKYLLLTSY